MLPRAHRLTSATDFKSAIRHGRRAGSRTMVVHLWVPESLESVGPETGLASGSRVGFVVSKAVGNAVARNLVKRRLRHLMRERHPSLPASGLLVVRALPASSEATYVELASELDRCLARVTT